MLKVNITDDAGEVLDSFYVVPFGGQKDREHVIRGAQSVRDTIERSHETTDLRTAALEMDTKAGGN
jgi:hypothetical protein